MAGVLFRPTTLPTKIEAVQDKGSYATVADAVANAPGEGLKDVVEINGFIHRWDGVTYKLDDDKAPIQTPATGDAFVLTEAQFNANTIVPYRDAGGSLQFYLPKKDQVDYATWAAQGTFAAKYEPEGATAENVPSYIGAVADVPTLTAITAGSSYGGRIVLVGDWSFIGSQLYNLTAAGWVRASYDDEYPKRGDTFPLPAAERLFELVGHATLPDSLFWSDGSQWIQA